MTDISSLLSRVRAASGPDEDIGRDLAKYFMNRKDHPTIAILCKLATSGGVEAVGAAVALVERALPDANTVGVEKSPKGATAYVARNYVNSGHWMTEVDAATPPLAILAALLSALEQKESDDDPRT